MDYLIVFAVMAMVALYVSADWSLPAENITFDRLRSSWLN
jgi:hypothetical protein